VPGNDSGNTCVNKSFRMNANRAAAGGPFPQCRNNSCIVRSMQMKYSKTRIYHFVANCFVE